MFESAEEPATLIVVQAKSLAAELFPEHSIFLPQILNCVQLALVHPARQGDQHESGTGPGTLTSDHLIIDDARDYLPLFQIDRVFGPYGMKSSWSLDGRCQPKIVVG